MSTDFVKKNWIYIALLCFIVAVNVLPRIGKEEAPQVKAEAEVTKEEPQTVFVNFEEAQIRSAKIENILKKNFPLYLFYISVNLLVVFIFFLGLVLNGYFVFTRFKKKNIFRKTDNINPPSWKIGDIFRIIILALTFSYIFFIVFSVILGALEPITGLQFKFYKSENFRMVFDTIVLDFVILLIILRFLRNVYKKKLADMGLMKENMARNIFYGVSGYVAVIPLIIIIGIIVYILLNILKLRPPPQPIVGLFLAEENVRLLFISSVIAAIFGPIIEEIFFRGVMYNAVKGKLGIFWAIFITSVLFSFLHTHAMSYFLVGFIPIAILGAVLAYLYEKTGSLVPSITLHILNNVGSVIMVFLFKYFNSLI